MKSKKNWSWFCGFERGSGADYERCYAGASRPMTEAGAKRSAENHTHYFWGQVRHASAFKIDRRRTRYRRIKLG